VALAPTGGWGTTKTITMPWAPKLKLYCAPGRLVLKLALGEAPDWIPTIRDVRTGDSRATDED